MLFPIVPVSPNTPFLQPHCSSQRDGAVSDLVFDPAANLQETQRTENHVALYHEHALSKMKTENATGQMPYILL